MTTIKGIKEQYQTPYSLRIDPNKLKSALNPLDKFNKEFKVKYLDPDEFRELLKQAQIEKTKTPKSVFKRIVGKLGNLVKQVLKHIR